MTLPTDQGRRGVGKGLARLSGGRCSLDGISLERGTEVEVEARLIPTTPETGRREAGQRGEAARRSISSEKPASFYSWPEHL
jgi:hypothetical protein